MFVDGKQQMSERMQKREEESVEGKDGWIEGWAEKEAGSFTLRKNL